ncbi:MAG: hypothetical protein NT074_01460 [Methanomicrobiales archaeon]|nr:hypothetical protein [Methanomicrobiales archaeon]
MDRTLLILIAVLLVMLATCTAFFYAISTVSATYLRTHEARLTYEVNVTADGQLTDVTFLLPLPLGQYATYPITEDLGVGPLPSLPKSWKTSLVGSERETFLKVEVPLIASGSVPGVGASTSFSHWVVVRGQLPTTDVLQTGYTLAPKEGVILTGCQDGGEEAARECMNYKGFVHARYEAEAATNATIKVTLKGENAWVLKGGQQNYYTDSLKCILTGPQSGWVKTEGLISEGYGDLDIFVALNCSDNPMHSAVWWGDVLWG